jgi:hypothetical protein
VLPSFVAQFNHFLLHRHPPRDRRGIACCTLGQDLLSFGGFPLQPPNFRLLHCDDQQAKKRPWPPAVWRLIATHPKLEIAGTRSKRRRSHFLIATKTAIHPLHNYLRPRGESARGRGSRITIHDSRVTVSLLVANSASEWPSRTERARMTMRLLLLKFSLGIHRGCKTALAAFFIWPE